MFEDGVVKVAGGLLKLQIKSEVLLLLPRKFCEARCVLPLWVHSDKDPLDFLGTRTKELLAIAMVNPENVYTLDEVRFKTGYQVHIYRAPEDDIREAIARSYSWLVAPAVLPTSRPRSGEVETAILEHCVSTIAGNDSDATRGIPKEVPMSEFSASAFVNGAVLSSFYISGVKEVLFQPAESGYVVNVKLDDGIRRTGRVIYDTTEKDMVVQYVGFITKDNRVTWKVSCASNEDATILSAEVFTYDLLEGKLITFRDFRVS